MKSSWADRWMSRLPGGQGRATQRFARNTDANLFLGIFDSFEAAAASAPAGRPLGYDNLESAALYLKRLRVDEFDYPALFWISLSLFEGMRSVADVGGSVGIKYFAFGRFLSYPQDMRWRVIDVPAVVRRGREFAHERGAPAALEFAESIDAIDGIDVVFASGSLQYLEHTLAHTIATLQQKPRRIVVNTTPIHPSRSFFTLNSVGTAFCPYRVQDREQFVHELTNLGYRLRDEWSNNGKSMVIPFHEDASLANYTGFCFDLA